MIKLEQTLTASLTERNTHLQRYFKPSENILETYSLFPQQPDCFLLK